MMANVFNEANFQRALELGVEERLREIASEEIAAAEEQASRRIRERIDAEVDVLAMRLLRYYEVHRSGERLVIEVRRPSDEDSCP